MTQETFARGFRFGEQFRVPEDGASGSHRKSGIDDAPNPLEAYFDSHTTGPGLWKWRHYFEIYHRHFAKFIGREVHVLEIGVYSGGSLSLWQNYFGSRCKLYGVDILEACRTYESETVRIFIGDQADRNFWKRIRAEVPVVDIVIDDGGHQAEQQIVSLEELLPHVRPGGVYLCEDVYKGFSDFHDYVAGMSQQLNVLGNARPGLTDPHDGLVTNPLQRTVKAVHTYPYVSVIEIAEQPVAEFVAPRRGTEWQPW